jgi:prepilin-type N-terminal cleavage/methylation domain-containing protein
MCTGRDPHTAAGFTMLELIVAMVVAALVVAYVLGSYTVLVRSFKHHSDTAESVRHMVVIKMQVDHALSSATQITASFGSTIEYLDSAKALHRLTVSDSVLCLDAKHLATRVRSLSCELKPIGNGEGLLLWESAIGPAGWIGGAVRVPMVGR